MNPAIRHVLSRKPICTQVEAFAEIAEDLTDREFWRLAGHIWAGPYFTKTAVYYYAALWHQIFQSQRAYRSHFTRNPADRLRWEHLGDLISCYRGYGRNNPIGADGIFYTLNYDIAEIHANAHCSLGEGWRIDGHVLFKTDCLFYGDTGEEVIHVPSLLLSSYACVNKTG